MATPPEIVQRKKDHLKIALSVDSHIGNPGFNRFRFIHNALPEINFDSIDTSTQFLGMTMKQPFFISCMTGGVDEGQKLNRNLAIAAQNKGIAMGVGSQRIAIQIPKYKSLFSIRKYAPDIPIMANLGLVQLNYGFGMSELLEIIKMVDANALVLHINPIQEVIQPEGDRNFEQLLPKLEKIIPKLPVPVIIKEVGFGLSFDVIKRLYATGVRIFDTAGWGGTNWAYIEGKRRDGFSQLGSLYSDWGIPTADSISAAKTLKDVKKDNKMVILGSGGIRSGMDIAKSIALGADLAGIAAPFAKAALTSSDSVEKLIEKLSYELRVTMFGVGALKTGELKKAKLVPAVNTI